MKMRISRKDILKGIFILCIGCFLFYSAASITFALIQDSSPNVIVVINADGSKSVSGNLFGNELWYPGKKVSGIIRIQNNFKPISINSLGFKTELTRTNGSISPSLVYNSFLRNMRLTISNGHMLAFGSTIVDDKSFYEMIDRSDAASDISAIDIEKLRLGRNSSADLEYTLHMHEDSGEELENMDVKVELVINVGE